MLSAEPNPAASTHGSRWSAWARRVLFGLCVVPWVLLVWSTWILPPLAAPDGLLRHPSPGTHSLALAHAALAVPRGGDWGRLDLAYRLGAGEALTLIPSRAEGGFVAVRLSPGPPLESALLTFESGAVVARSPLPPVPDVGTVRVERGPGVILVSVDGRPVARMPAAALAHGAGNLELALFPPSIERLYDRVHVVSLEAADGRRIRALSPIELSRSPLAAVPIGLLLAWALSRPCARLAARLFPSQRNGGSIDAFLACISLVLVADSALPRILTLALVTPDTRFFFRAFSVGTLAWCVGFMAIRDLVHRRLRGGPHGWMVHPALLVPAFVVLTPLVTGAVLQGLRAVALVNPASFPRPTAPPGAADVAVYGGSTVRGAPFETGTVPSYPSLLEAHLAADVGVRARVWNMGADSANVGDVVRIVERQAADLRDAYVVVSSIENNVYDEGHTTEDRFRELIRIASSAGAHLILVKEPTLDTVYGLTPEPGISAGYRLLDQLAAEANVPVADPNPEFARHRDEFLFMDRAHLAPRGNEVMAMALAQALAPLIVAKPVNR